MSKRTQGVLLRASRHEAETLQLAREIVANPQAYIPLVVTWAKRVLGDADMEAQRRLPLGPDSEESRAVSSSVRTLARPGGVASSRPRPREEAARDD